MNTYLFLYSSHFTREEVKDFLDSAPGVAHWYTCLPNSFFVATESRSKELADQFREVANGRGSFIILSVRGDRDGWLPREAWDLMAKPRQVVEHIERAKKRGELE